MPGVPDLPLIAVVGGGIIGLSCATALAQRGARVLLIGQSRAGEASPAAAGMLAPRVESEDTPSRTLGIAARDRYPGWLQELRETTGVSVTLLRNGVLQLAPDDAAASAMRARHAAGSRWLDSDQVRDLEPGLSPTAGALLHEDDGAVDNVALLEALRRRLSLERHVSVVRDDVVRIVPRRPHPAILTRASRFEVDRIVLAAGAWVNDIAGLPAPLPVEPLRGQMHAVSGTPIERVVFAQHAYLVPRKGTTLVGATMERVGFVVDTTEEAQSALRAASVATAPSLAKGDVVLRWSGLRPATPDFLPIVGSDPMYPALIYACGHSRNGILLAPLTGDCVAALALGEQPAYDLAPFSPARFRR